MFSGPWVGFGLGSVRFLVYTPTVLVFPLFASPFVSRVFRSFSTVAGVLEVTPRCLTSRDNSIFLYAGTSWATITQCLLALTVWSV